MNLRLKHYFVLLLSLWAAASLIAQQQPVMTVSITQVAVLTNGTPPGQVAFIDITNVGANYTSAPTVTIAAPGGGGTQATAIATINLSGAVSSVIIQYPGTGYTSRPTITFSPPTNPPAGQLGVTAAATAYVGGSFVAPFQNESYGDAGTAIAITAQAVGTFPAAGFTYEFFVDGVSIGFAVAHPQAGTPASVGWTPPRPGAYFLTVVATDGLGHTATSLPVRYFAMGTMITSPTPNTIVPNSSSVVVQATAMPQPLNIGTPGNNAFVKRMDFYVDGQATPFASDDTAPYSFIYTPPAPPTALSPSNRHQIEARAVDNNGNQVSPNGTAVLDLFMVPPIGTPPTISISSPLDNASIAIPSGSASDISVAVSAGSTAGLITKVELYIDGVLFGTSTTFPYSFSWRPTVLGPYHLIALAYDDKSNVVASSVAPASTTVTIVPGGAGGGGAVGSSPVVSITAPPAGTQVGFNQPTLVTASATDSDGNIASVNFLVNGVSIGTSGYPYNVVWTPTSLGPYSLTVQATDNDGNAVTSAAIAVTVIDPSSSAPSVSVTSPSSGAALLAGIPTTVQASASDDVAVSSVQFYVNGVALGTAVTSFPFSVSWTPTVAGSYTFVAIAKDGSGNQTTSVPVTVSVNAGSGPTVSITSPSSGSSVALGSGVQINTLASDADGTIRQVRLLANGIPIAGATLTTAPYNFNWVPTNAGGYSIMAEATDNTGNVTTSSTVTVSVTSSVAPTVSIASPASASSYGIGTPISFTATTSASGGSPVTQVQFFVNGISVGIDGSAPYSVTWTPNGTGTYTLTAAATNSASITATSSAVTVTIGTNQAPVVTVTSPLPGTTSVAGNAVNLAATATDVDGRVVAVRFLANGTLVGSAGAAPFLAAWTPSASGSYSIVAEATDNSGNVTTSSAVTLTVSGNSAPTVSVTSPRTGATVPVATSTTVSATAADADGTIASVQFYANNVSLGTDSVAPYSVTWTPSAEGIYRLTAVAIDSSGAVTTSSAVTVLASVPGSATIDTVATGIYIDTKTFSSGEFTAINLHNRSTTFIAYVPAAQNLTPAKTYYFANIPTDGSGNFELSDSSGVVQISGKFSATGVSGTFADGSNQINFTGAITTSTGTTTTAFYNGSVTNHLGSVLTGIAGLDGRITLYAQDGTLTDAGSTTLDVSGGFTLTTRGGNRFVGTADPTTGLLTGTVRKQGTTVTDGFTAAQASGNSYSDGSLRNISSRVFVGTGEQILIAGFVVNGATPKSVLLRAIGPTLTANGVSGALANPTLFLFNRSGLQIASNDNWSTGGAAVSNAAAAVGAFPLPASSLDSSLVVSLTPGVYSAQVSGVGGTSGIALLEIYDVDSVASYASEKMVNISTRGQVGTGDNVMIAGFVVNGTAPKKVMIRGVGPTLTAAGVTGALADPVLRILRLNGSLVRENDNWSVGNDVNLVNDAAVKVGAFPLATGSKDAVVLMNLMPGVYSAQLSGANGGTGIGLIEVYEVQ